MKAAQLRDFDDRTFWIGALRPWQLLIPRGLARAYKVIGTEPAMPVYVTSRFYDRGDEGRLPCSDARINYGREMQHK